MTSLHRRDIVGRSIARVLTTPRTVEDGVTTCTTFVELAGGPAFELLVADTHPRLALPRVEALAEDLEPALDLRQCFGDTVEDVLVAEVWPSIGLLLDSRCFLVATSYAPDVFGPMLFPVGEYYDLDDGERWTGPSGDSG